MNDAAHAAPGGPNVKVYLAVFTALAFLTIVTVLVSYLHLPKAPAVLIALAIATAKASLVAAFFMHLKGERLLIIGLLGLSLFFVAMLFLLPLADTVATSGTRAEQAQSVPAGEHVP